MVFAARQFQKKCQEQNAELYSTYIDMTKAFDTFSRDGLWRIMAKYGCPLKFITFVRQLHAGMLVRVQDNGEISQLSPVSNGVRQEYVLAPHTPPPPQLPPPPSPRHSVFNLRRLQAKPRSHKTPSMTSCLPTTVP